MSSLYEQIKADLGYLKLDAAAGVFATLAEQAKTEDWSHIEFLARLIAEQQRAVMCVEYVSQGTRCLDLPLLKHHHVIRKARYFIGGMRHIKHRRAQRIAHTLQPRHDHVAARPIQ